MMLIRLHEKRNKEVLMAAIKCGMERKPEHKSEATPHDDSYGSTNASHQEALAIKTE